MELNGQSPCKRSGKLRTKINTSSVAKSDDQLAGKRNRKSGKICANSQRRVTEIVGCNLIVTTISGFPDLFILLTI